MLKRMVLCQTDTGARLRSGNVPYGSSSNTARISLAVEGNLLAEKSNLNNETLRQ